MPRPRHPAPTPGQPDQVAQDEKSLFNRTELKRFARAGVPPSLPEGRTPAERRGRVWLTDDNPLNGNPARGRCVHCHSGPMLNQFSAGAVALGFPAPLGARFFSAFVLEFNLGGQPVQTYAFVQTANGATVTNYVTSPDLGRALVTGKVQDANAFKIPTLLGGQGHRAVLSQQQRGLPRGVDGALPGLLPGGLRRPRGTWIHAGARLRAGRDDRCRQGRHPGLSAEALTDRRAPRPRASAGGPEERSTVARGDSMLAPR